MKEHPHMPEPQHNHIYVLLDRSGSMASMVSDVIGGFNHLVADHQADDRAAVFTLVQFDSQDPHEVVADAVAVTAVQPLTADTFVPRGGTPLLDATGAVIARAGRRALERAEAGEPPERVTIITITDGQENQSREYSRQAIKELIAAREAMGWTFAFLGAGPDAYAEAGGMGYDERSVQAYRADGAGTSAAFASVARALRTKRQRRLAGEDVDPADFFEGVKEAEADRDEPAG